MSNKHLFLPWLNVNNTPSLLTEPTSLSADYIRHQLIIQLEHVLGYLLPQGRIRGHQFEVGDIDGNKGDSLKVEMQGSKAGLWHDFATKEGGDIIDLWAACHQLNANTNFESVLRSAHAWLGMQDNANPSSPAVGSGRYTDKWDYVDKDNRLIACVYRYDTKGGKHYRPRDVLQKRDKAPNPRPLYNQHDMLKATQVVLVEGEKAADALISQGIVATTAMFGANASLDKTDWSPLKGKHLIIWPDNDAPGLKYAQAVSEYLANTGLLLSQQILSIPEDKPDKWDAADALAQGINVKDFINNNKQSHVSIIPSLQAYSVDQFIHDSSPMPTDLIAPRLLTPSGLMVLGGAPKVGKSDFLLSLLMHMAAGLPFLGLTPPRPLKIFYLQTEVGYHYLRERLQQCDFDENALSLAGKNLVITPQSTLLLNENGVNAVKQTIYNHFDDGNVDIIAIDPLRNIFDGGGADEGENNNTSMLFFLQQRLDTLRQAVNPDAGIILAHHTRKIQKKQLLEDPFQALSGASSLRSYYTTGMLLFKDSEEPSQRQLFFELRNGSTLGNKHIDKVNGQWREVNHDNKCLVKNNYNKKLGAERQRNYDIIIKLIQKQAKAGRIYTINQFCQTFENEDGLGSANTIRARLNILASKGLVKFFKNAKAYGIADPIRTKYGFLCVENMYIPSDKKQINPDTGEVSQTLHCINPTHYKCQQTAAVLPIENKQIWKHHQEDLS